MNANVEQQMEAMSQHGTARQTTALESPGKLVIAGAVPFVSVSPASRAARCTRTPHAARRTGDMQPQDMAMPAGLDSLGRRDWDWDCDWGWDSTTQRHRLAQQSVIH